MTFSPAERAMPAMRSVYSHNVAEIGYDADRQLLFVRFTNKREPFKDGRLAVYQAVPPEIAARVMSAPSVGEALAADVKGRFEYGYLEEQVG